MADKIATNTFDKGMNLDLNPLVAPNNVMSYCLNGTFLTFNGDDYTLQNDMGNTAIKKENKDNEFVKLSEGFIPIGSCQLGGVLYIASYNPLTNKGEIGSFPSITTNQITKELILNPINISQLIKENCIYDYVYYKVGPDQLKIIINYGDSIKINLQPQNELLDSLINEGFIKCSFIAGDNNLKLEDEEYIYNNESSEYLQIKYEWVDPQEFYFGYDCTSQGAFLIYSGDYNKEFNNYSIQIKINDIPTGLTKFENNNLFYSKEYIICENNNILYNIIVSDYINIEQDISYNDYLTLEYRYFWDYDKDQLQKLIWKICNPNDLSEQFIYEYNLGDDLNNPKLNKDLQQFIWEVTPGKYCKRPCICNDLYNDYFDSYKNKDFINLSFNPDYKLIYQNLNILETEEFESQLEKNYNNSNNYIFTFERISDYNLKLIPSKFSNYINFTSKEFLYNVSNSAKLPTSGNAEIKSISNIKTLQKFTNSNVLNDKINQGLFILGAGCRDEKGHGDNHSVDLFYINLEDSYHVEEIYEYPPITKDFIGIKYQLTSDESKYNCVNFTEFDEISEYLKNISINRISQNYYDVTFEFKYYSIYIDNIILGMDYYVCHYENVEQKHYNDNGEITPFPKTIFELTQTSDTEINIDIYNLPIEVNEDKSEINHLLLNIGEEIINPFTPSKHKETIELKGDSINLWYKRADSSFEIKYKDVQNQFDQFILSHMQNTSYSLIGGVQCFVHSAQELYDIYAGEGVKEHLLNSDHLFDNQIPHDAEENDTTEIPYQYYSGSINYKIGKNGKDGIDKSDPWKSTKPGYCIIIKLSESEYCISQPLPGNLINKDSKVINVERAFSNLINLFDNKYCACLHKEKFDYFKFVPESYLKFENFNIITNLEFQTKYFYNDNSLELRFKKHLLYPTNESYSVVLNPEINYFNEESRFLQVQNYLDELFSEFEQDIQLVYLNYKNGINFLRSKDNNNNNFDSSFVYDSNFNIDDKLEYDDEYETLLPKELSDGENNYWTYIKPDKYNTQFSYSGILTTQL